MSMSVHITMKEGAITTGVFLKNAAYFPAFLLGLSHESYMILSVFMLADLILGISRSVILHGPQSIKSYKLTAGIVSKILVLCVPLILVWAGRGAGMDFTFLGQWAVGALVLSQAYSMLGHINAIRLGEEVAEWDAVSVIMQKLRKALEAVLVDGHNAEKL